MGVQILHVEKRTHYEKNLLYKLIMYTDISPTKITFYDPPQCHSGAASLLQSSQLFVFNNNNEFQSNKKK